MAVVANLQPLNWQVPLVNPDRTPTSEFQRAWASLQTATGDIPALDTVFLVGSPAHKGAVVQYVGRILRSHPGKTSAEVHDYHDIDVPVLASALAKRTPGYAALGFPDPRRR